MTIIIKNASRYTGKSFILCLLAWFLICSILYIVVHFWEGSRRSDLLKTGVAISKDISSQSGLPLLERKIDHLGRLIEDITEKPEVVFASIIDHKNKLIAYTNQDQFFTFSREKSDELEGVHYWRVSNLNHQKVINFSSEITFSGTRVGEVLISLAAENMGLLRRSFSFFAVLTLTVLVLFFGFVRHREFLVWWNTKYKQFNAPVEPFSDQKENNDFFCPLCSNRGHFSRDSCHMTDLESFLLIKSYSETNKDVMLRDLEKVKELSWLKKRIIAQCGKIITTISLE
ncbi:MAG: hypothetical protein GY860_27010 [Desulfobacteraceae bacterium]|nr:hypothetical protein [Desulfobacteraceae bacterium]